MFTIYESLLVVVMPYTNTGTNPNLTLTVMSLIYKQDAVHFSGRPYNFFILLR